MPHSTKGLALKAASCFRCSRCSRIRSTEFNCFSRLLVTPILGRIDGTRGNEGLDQLPVSSPAPTVACMTRGDVRGLDGMAWTGLVGLAVGLLSQATVTELYQN